MFMSKVETLGMRISISLNKNIVERLKTRLGIKEEKNYIKTGLWKYSSHKPKKTHLRSLGPHQMNEYICFWNY